MYGIARTALSGLWDSLIAASTFHPCDTAAAGPARIMPYFLFSVVWNVNTRLITSAIFVRKRRNGKTIPWAIPIRIVYCVYNWFWRLLIGIAQIIDFGDCLWNRNIQTTDFGDLDCQLIRSVQTVDSATVYYLELSGQLISETVSWNVYTSGHEAVYYLELSKKIISKTVH